MTEAKIKSRWDDIPLITEKKLLRMADKHYMNDEQLSFFRHKLLTMREELTSRTSEVKERLHTNESIADPNDRASLEEEHWLDLRLREREAYLIKKIDESLQDIENGDYGWCEQSGDPIGIPRLLARPTATVSIDVKNISEHNEMHFSDNR